ncbi:MAG: hypothetical protein ACOX3A_11215 [bacterium]
MLLGVIIFFFTLIVSVRERVRLKRISIKDRKELPVEPKPSQFTVAMGELLAVAGGIYLTLLVTVTFLDIEVPARVNIGFASLEPLAAISLLIAILQPWLLRFLPRY